MGLCADSANSNAGGCERQSPTAIAAGDFDGDGKLDLVVVDSTPTSALLSTLIGNGDGTFQGHVEYSVPTVSNNVNFMLAADFNGDGALDMALADYCDRDKWRPHSNHDLTLNVQ